MSPITFGFSCTFLFLPLELFWRCSPLRTIGGENRAELPFTCFSFPRFVALLAGWRVIVARWWPWKVLKVYDVRSRSQATVLKWNYSRKRQTQWPGSNREMKTKGKRVHECGEKSVLVLIRKCLIFIFVNQENLCVHQWYICTDISNDILWDYTTLCHKRLRQNINITNFIWTFIIVNCCTNAWSSCTRSRHAYISHTGLSCPSGWGCHQSNTVKLCLAIWSVGRPRTNLGLITPFKHKLHIGWESQTSRSVCMRAVKCPT